MVVTLPERQNVPKNTMKIPLNPRSKQIIKNQTSKREIKLIWEDLIKKLKKVIGKIQKQVKFCLLTGIQSVTEAVHGNCLRMRKQLKMEKSVLLLLVQMEDSLGSRQ